jgi:hypothetical protein
MNLNIEAGDVSVFNVGDEETPSAAIVGGATNSDDGRPRFATVVCFLIK